MSQKMRRVVLLSIFSVLGVATGGLFAQSCPAGDNIAAPESSLLRGTLRYHDVTRPWLGLAMQQPACGAQEIELVFSGDGWRAAKRMRGCGVTVEGRILESPTTYYATDLNLMDAAITPDPGCRLLPADPDYEALRIPEGVGSYRLTVFIDVRANKPLRGGVVGTGGTTGSLRPWRAYATLMLNGEEDLTVGCRDGYDLVSWKSSHPNLAQRMESQVLLSSSQLGPAWVMVQCRRE